MLVRPALLLRAATTLLSGCQLRPIYANGGSGAVATALANIEVGPIYNRSGWLVRQELIDRLCTPQSTPSYRIRVELDAGIVGYGIRSADANTCHRRTLRSSYHHASGAPGLVLAPATAAQAP